jgi:CHAT domain-containing protein
MYENRSAAYLQLIQKLLECPSAKKLEILNAHFELLDPNFLQMIIVVTKQFSDNGNRNEVDFLTDLAFKIGEFLGYDNQSISLRKQTADILLQWGIEQYYISHLVAFQCWQQCLMIYQAVHDREGEAATLVNLGIAYASQGEYERVIDLQQQSLAIYREIGDRQCEAKSLGNLGNGYYFMGQYKEAFASYEESLALCQKIGDRQGEATTLVNLGSAYNSLGQYELAIAKEEESLAISRELGDRLGEASSLGNLGNACRYLRRFKEAIDFYEQSLAIFQDIENHLGEANSLGSLGSACCSLGEYEQAIAYHKKSLAISQKIGDLIGEGNSLGNLGNAYDSLGEFELAIDYHEGSLAISLEIRDLLGQGNSLNNIGNAYRQLQQTDKAIEKYQDSLKIAIPETMPAECFAVGQNLGNIGFTKGDWHLALEGYEPALQAVEQLRKGSTTDDRRQEIIEDAFFVYINSVQCYINLKQYDRAVETADRSRSRHLADLFYSSKDLYPQGEIPPEVAAYYRLQQQSDRLRISENDGMKPLTATPQPTPNGDAIIKKIEELEEEKKKVWLKIRSKDEVLAGQLQPELLYVKDMQALIPDAETAILNFYTTGEHTHIFILRQNQPPQLHTCEGQGLETLQNWLLNNWLKPYVETPTAWQNQMGKFFLELANRLQINKLISQHLNGIKELIIIPHLYLHQIPFAALPLNDVPIPQSDTASGQARIPKRQTPRSKTESQTSPQQQPEYLSDRFRLRIVPSCQILNFCHQRGNLKPVTMGIVQYDPGDLVFTGYECQTLATMHQVDKNYRLQSQEATINNYHKLLNQVQVLHSSHHASADLNNSLESKLLLSDGDINLGRVFTWRFSDLAEVFLSCCETNLTLTQITDDPLSIASGFLCAGARNVVSTLWAVDDLATALFCILYYEEKKDNSRSEALRKAQFKLRNLTGNELSGKYERQLNDYLEHKKNRENAIKIIIIQDDLESLCKKTLPFVSPYYWAGFVSQGLA